MKKQLLRLSALSAAAVTSAHAALPTEVTAAVATYQLDATTAINLVMAAGIVIWGLLKLKSKMGW